jgi:hypothetical protein
MLNAAIAQNPISAVLPVLSVSAQDLVALPVILVDMIVYVPGTGIKVLTFCSGRGAVVGGLYYEPRISDPGSLKIMLFAEGTTSGESQVGYGEVVLLNPDGGLDALLDYGLDGRDLVIRKLIAGVATLLMSCSMSQPAVTTGDVSIKIQDPQTKLAVPVQANLYGGTNVLPAGVDGTADIKGKKKPLFYGKIFNATPVLVNTSKLIYQTNDVTVQDIPTVYDKGVYLLRGADYLSVADMEANAPQPGTYRVLLSGYFRLGSSPVGTVTFDGVEGASAADRTAAQVSKRIALRALGSYDLAAQSFADLDALNSAEIGIYIIEDMTVNTALDLVLGSIGAWHAFDARAKLNVGRLDNPAGVPVLSLTPAEVKSVEQLPTSDFGNGIPAWNIIVNYAKNYTVQTTDLAGSVLTPSVWSAGTPLANLPYRRLLFGSGLFVLLADGTTTYYTSPDGVIWTARTLPSAGTWLAGCYANGRFVIAAYNSAVGYTSTDGINWTACGGLPSGYWYDIAYGNGVYVAVASFGTVAASSGDGVTWTARTLPISGDHRCIAYGNGTFVAPMYSPATNVMLSADGITWTTQLIPFSTGTMDSIIFGNGLFVMKAYQGNATSVDGVNWIQQMRTGGNLDRTVFTNGVFMTASFELGKLVSRTSSNGAQWITNPVANINPGSGVTGAGNGVFVIIDDDANTVYSVAVGATDSRRVWLGAEYRTVNAPDASVKTVHLLASELTFDTLLVSPAAAQAEADRLLALRKVRRDFLLVSCKQSALSLIPNPGGIVQLTYPRFGYDGGKLFIYLGLQMHLGTDDITLFFWG